MLAVGHDQNLSVPFQGPIPPHKRQKPMAAAFTCERVNAEEAREASTEVLPHVPAYEAAPAADA